GLDEAFHRFDPTTRSFSEHPASLARPSAARGAMVGVNADGRDRFWVRTSATSPAGRKIAHAWRVTPAGDWMKLPVAVTEAAGGDVIFHEEDGVLWLGGSEGLVRVELPAALAEPKPLAARVGRVLDSRQHALAFASDSLNLAPGANALTVQLAADGFGAPGLAFQTRLLGRDPEWSPPATHGAI